jgi:hypothetical protein
MEATQDRTVDELVEYLCGEDFARVCQDRERLKEAMREFIINTKKDEDDDIVCEAIGFRAGFIASAKLKVE